MRSYGAGRCSPKLVASCLRPEHASVCAKQPTTDTMSPGGRQASTLWLCGATGGERDYNQS